MALRLYGDGNIENVTSINTSVSSTELGYLDGVTSAIQNQMIDYQTGSWTPEFTGAGTPTHTTQFGRYTKIGRLVYCSIAIRATGVSGTATVGISGLPFASAETADTAQRSCWILANGGHLSGLSEPTGRFRINGSNMVGVKGASATTYLTAAQMTSTGSIQLTGDFFYYTS